MKRTSLIAAALATTAILPTVALAIPATAVTDLNIRSGPGVDYEIVGVIDGEAVAEVEGCIESVQWCRVSYDGVTGWAYGEYLNTEATAEVEAMALTAPSVEVETITYDREPTEGEQREGAAAGATLGALIAYAAGGPAGGIIASGIFGAAAGSATTPEVEETVVYVRQNPVEPVYLDGEVVVGAGLPDGVDTYELPTVEGYRYVNVNGVPVIVENESGVIVEIVR